MDTMEFGVAVFLLKCILYLFPFTDTLSEQRVHNEGSAYLRGCRGAGTGEAILQVRRRCPKSSVESEYIVHEIHVNKPFQLVTDGTTYRAEALRLWRCRLLYIQFGFATYDTYDS